MNYHPLTTRILLDTHKRMQAVLARTGLKKQHFVENAVLAETIKTEQLLKRMTKDEA